MIRLVAASLTLLLALGCTGHLEEDWSNRSDTLSGTMGGTVFSGAPELREMRLTSRELYLDLRLSDPDGNWAVMVGLSIPRDRAREDAVGSTTLALGVEDAEMIGCAGPEDGEWEFDCPPDDLRVDVLEGKDSVSVDFGGIFGSDGCRDYGGPPEGEEIGGYVDVDLI